jgi:hypothetical protein
MRHYEWVQRGDGSDAKGLVDLEQSDEETSNLIHWAVANGWGNGRIDPGYLSALVSTVRLFKRNGGIVVDLSTNDVDVFGSIPLGPIASGDFFLPHKCVFFDMHGLKIETTFEGGADSETVAGEIEGVYAMMLPCTCGCAKGQVVLNVCILCNPPAGGTARGMTSFYVDLDGDGDAIEASINKQSRERDNVGSKYTEENAVSTLTAVRSAINAILYWTSPEAKTTVDRSSLARASQLERDIARAKSPGKKKDLKRKLDAITRVTITRFDIGHGDGVLPPHEGERGHVRRHKVAAHWSHYWVGKDHPLFDKGLAETEDGKRRIRKLVTEHWRGETAAGRIVSRIHKI